MCGVVVLVCLHACVSACAHALACVCLRSCDCVCEFVVCVSVYDVWSCIFLLIAQSSVSVHNVAGEDVARFSGYRNIEARGCSWNVICISVSVLFRIFLFIYLFLSILKFMSL